MNDEVICESCGAKQTKVHSKQQDEIPLSCPKCFGQLSVDKENKVIFCEHCNNFGLSLNK